MLSKRKQLILAAIVDRYIQTGEPVGSKTICDVLEISLSPATIRNEMYELDEMGYLKQPHTSAGRIPTEMCYRLYVDRLMTRQPITKSDQMLIDSLLFVNQPKNSDPEKLLEHAQKVLTQLTALPSVTTTPSHENDRISHINIIPTSRHIILLVIVTDLGVVKSSTSRCDLELTIELIQTLNRFFNERLGGQPLKSITDEYMDSIADCLGELKFPLGKLLNDIKTTIDEIASTKVRLEGSVNLLYYPEFQGEQIRELLRFLSNQEGLSDLLSKPKNDVHVVIGSESNIKEMSSTAVVYAKYQVNKNRAGTIGIIGPTRMNYAKMTSYLQYYAGCLSKLLFEVHGED